MGTTRRELFSRLSLGLSVWPALALAPRSVLSSLLFEPDGEPVPVKPVPVNPFTRNGQALVAMVHGQDPGAMLQAGLELIGGLDALALRGKRVLIKPNVVNDRPPPTTTDPQVVASVVRAVRQGGAAEVIVADSSGIIRFPTAGNLAATGIGAAAEQAGARVLALDDEPWVRIEPAGAKSLPRYYLSKPAYDADVFINVPVIKTHRFAEYSCCLKNLVGITHPRYRPSLAFLSGDWHERIAELNLGAHPHLNIADGTTIMIAGGPTSDTSAPANLLLLSGDRLALDAVAIALIRTFGAWPKLQGKRIWDQRQLKRGVELGLGVGGPERMELVVRSTVDDRAQFDRLADAVRRDLFG
jgi:uncharacterized protein (DUF362 family)